MLLSTAHAKDGEALGCKHCDGRVSSHELNFCKTVDALKQEMGHIPYTVTESKILRKNFGAADFFFPDYNLAVQVDGQHHFTREARDDTADGAEPREQAKRDEKWNQACVTNGFNIWRVHYADATAPPAVLKAILLRSGSNKETAFIEYSRGFSTV